MSSRVNFIPVILVLVLLYAFVVRVININYNSPFLDEAIYIVLGKKILEGKIAEVASSISWVGGFPFFYPFLSAIFYSIGGIVGSRFFNVILGTATVYLTYLFTQQLYLSEDRKTMRIAGLVSAGFMATSAIAVAFSRLAIYDALSVFIYLMGIVFLARAIFEGEKRWYLFSALILFGAFLAKYIVFIYFPFLLILTLYLAIKTGLKESVRGIFIYFWLPLIFFTLVYLGLNFNSLWDFIWGQTLKENASYGEIISSFWRFSYWPFLLSLGGFFFLWLRGRRFISILLLAGALIPLIIHLIARESLSVHQHSIFSLIFILPVVGLFFSILINRFNQIGIIAAAAAVFVNLFISIPKISDLGEFWPDTTKAVSVLKDNVKADHKMLVESGDAIYLGIYELVPSENITGPFVFAYNDLEGYEAYVQAINDGYFNYIELDRSSFPADAISQFENLLPLKYSLIFDDGKVQIYQLKS